MSKSTIYLTLAISWLTFGANQSRSAVVSGATLGFNVPTNSYRGLFDHGTLTVGQWVCNWQDQQMYLGFDAGIPGAPPLAAGASLVGNGAVIGAGTAFQTASGQLYWLNTMRIITSCGWTGSGPSSDPPALLVSHSERAAAGDLLPLSVTLGDGIHYGYMVFKLPTANDTTLFFDSMWESQPNTPLTVTLVPEPTVVILGLMGVGLMCSRRRSRA